ncbi:MAG: CBS domain-containing protein [Candidatus Woesearchaeota archaeon]
MQVKEIMHSVTKIPSDSSITEAALIMDQKSIGSVLIEENDEIVGIMTERDILRKIVAQGKNPDEVRVNGIMSQPLITIDANEDIVKASEEMDKRRIRRLVVTENGKIVGKVTANSIARNLKYALTSSSLRARKEYTRPEY